MPTDNAPRRFRITIKDNSKRPFESALRFGVYFPGTDLCVNDMGGRGTGEPGGVEWIDAGMRLAEIKAALPRFDVNTFEHVLGHVSKAAGKLHGLVGDADHIEEANRTSRGAAFEAAEAMNGKPASAFIADLIVCAVSLASLCPSGEIDLEKAVAERIAEKRDYLKQYGLPPLGVVEDRSPEQLATDGDAAGL